MNNLSLYALKLRMGGDSVSKYERPTLNITVPSPRPA